MRIATYILAGMLVLFGMLGVVAGLSSFGSAESPGASVVGGLLFLSWGILLGWYRAKAYRGGAATIVGAILLSFGAFSASRSLLWRVPVSRKDVGREIATFVGFVVPGVALLMQGRAIHRLKTDKPTANTQPLLEDELDAS